MPVALEQSCYGRLREYGWGVCIRLAFLASSFFLLLSAVLLLRQIHTLRIACAMSFFSMAPFLPPNYLSIFCPCLALNLVMRRYVSTNVCMSCSPLAGRCVVFVPRFLSLGLRSFHGGC